MSSHRSLLIAALALVTWSAVASPATAAPRVTRCYPAKAVTLQASESVRVYQRRGSVVACALRTGRKMRLGPARGGGGREVASLAVGGRYVAYAIGSAPEGAAGPFASESLTLLDMRRRRTVAFGTTGCADVPGATVSIPSLAVTGSRQMAWICAASGPEGGRAEVRKFDGSGAALLDSSDSLTSPDSITLTSLAVSRTGSLVYWARGAAAEAARLT